MAKEKPEVEPEIKPPVETPSSTKTDTDAARIKKHADERNKRMGRRGKQYRWVNTDGQALSAEGLGYVRVPSDEIPDELKGSQMAKAGCKLMVKNYA